MGKKRRKKVRKARVADLAKDLTPECWAKVEKLIAQLSWGPREEENEE